MSNLILLPFLALVIPGAVLVSLGRSKNPTDGQIKSQIWGGVLLGIAFLFFGFTCIVGTKISAQPEVTGILTNLRQFDGGHNKSAQFQVVHGSEPTHILSCRYNGSSLQDGETVFVRYLDFDHSILYLRVLDGPHAGFTVALPARPWLGAIVMPISLASFWLAYVGVCKIRSSNRLQST
jgi:hypothetical protein